MKAGRSVSQQMRQPDPYALKKVCKKRQILPHLNIDREVPSEFICPVAFTHLGFISTLPSILSLHQVGLVVKAGEAIFRNDFPITTLYPCTVSLSWENLFPFSSR